MLRTEWFYLSDVPLSNFIDYLDCDVAGEDVCQPEDSDVEIQFTVAI